MKKRFMSLAMLLAFSPSLLAMEADAKEEEKAAEAASEEVAPAQAEKVLPEDLELLKAFTDRVRLSLAHLTKSNEQLASLKIADTDELTPEQQKEQSNIACAQEQVPLIICGLTTVKENIKSTVKTLRSWSDMFSSTFTFTTKFTAEASKDDEIISDLVANLEMTKLFIQEFNERFADIKQKDADAVKDKFTVIEEDLALIVKDADRVIKTLRPEATVSDMVWNLFNKLKATVQEHIQNV